MPNQTKKKHLKLRGKWLPEEMKVEVTVVEQSHFDGEFGNSLPLPNWTTNNHFRSPEVPNYALMSQGIAYQQRYAHTEHNKPAEVWFLVVPNSDASFDRTFKITNEEWQILKKLVNLYNEQ